MRLTTLILCKLYEHLPVYWDGNYLMFNRQVCLMEFSLKADLFIKNNGVNKNFYTCKS